VTLEFIEQKIDNPKPTVFTVLTVFLYRSKRMNVFSTFNLYSIAAS